MRLRTVLTLVTSVALYGGSVAAFHPHGDAQNVMVGAFCGMFSSMFWDRGNR